ncbi:hypothetical protein M2R85_27080, partial [Klebsiella pneumoniae]|nr:hypothetical protein [Klebsiella pneumoniae]MDZ0147253.1 hypothetical protein [Klebsiella pneumoniae]MDZ0291054.1 hypothetical protein [Klebsiella pneumoniae]MDZ1843864.1 hypothetical protein [Klebsiella pneumoniae]MDZ2637757.1 hypothetical protein [Klebsiella pneumoniae]
FAGKKSAQIREILISESAWEEMTCLFAPSLGYSNTYQVTYSLVNYHRLFLAKMMYILSHLFKHRIAIWQT